MTSSPQPLWLRDPIHMAWCGADVVVLDVASDEYALLVDMADAIRPSDATGQILVGADVRPDLEALGLISQDPPSRPRPALPDRRGEIVQSEGAGDGLALSAALIDSLMSTAAFQRKDMASLVESAARRAPQARRTSPELVARSLGAFQTLQPWIPFEGDCLQRGFMLHHHLRRSDIAAQWVFGVRTWPFLAHCWVQVGDSIVGDSLERVCGFTPIMAV